MAEISVDVKLSGAQQAQSALAALDNAATSAAKSAAALGSATSQAGGGLSSMASKSASAATSAASIGTAATGATKGVALMGTAVSAALGPLTALVAVGASFKAVFGNIVEFDKLSGQVKTVTGDAKSAAIAMDGLRAIATALPVELSELTGSFVKLQARGFDTTAKSMRSISDLASALGGSFGQVSEAITDLAVGQTQRIEELGISATQENGKIQLAFGKTAIEVEKNAADIQRAIDQITFENFAGASAEQMDRLTGRISNLQDAFANLSVTLGQIGVYSALASAVGWATDAISGLAQGMQELAAIAATTWAIIKSPTSFGAEIYKLEGALTQIEAKYSAVGTAATDAYDKQSKAATDAMRARIAENTAAQQAEAARAEAAKKAAKEQEAAAKRAAAAAQAAHEAVMRQAEQQTQAVETYAEKLDRQLASYQALAQAAGAAFGDEALIRSQVAALAEYGKAVDGAYESETRRAEASMSAARTIYEQVEASQKLVAIQREIADSKASYAIELASQGLITQEAATRAASAAWAQYSRAVENVGIGDIVAEWERLNVEIGYTPKALEVSAESMLRFGMAADGITATVGSIITEVERIAPTNKAQTDDVKAAWEEAGRSIQRSLSDSFYDVIDNGIKSFKDFGNAIVDIIKRAAADIAAALVFEAVVKPVSTSVIGAASSAAGSAAVSSASTSGVIAAIKESAGSLIGSITASVGSIIPSITSITSAIGPAVAGIIGAIGPIGIAVGAAAAVLGVLGVDLRGLLGNVIDASLAIPEAIFSAAGDLIESIVGAAADILSGIASAIGGVVTDAAGGVIGAVTDVVGGAFDAVGDVLGGIFHGGGVVGQTPVQTRQLPAATWAGAPRLHSGTPTLRHDEYPAILQKGEAVIPLKNGAVPVIGAGGQSTINIFGAPAGSRTRKRGRSVDIFIRSLERELTPDMAALAGG